MSISVFVSYAVETDAHNNRVLQFVNKLKMNGIDVCVFNDMKLGERFTTFMERIDSCDFTLVICTPEYKKRADKRSGGVGYEWNIVTSSVASAFDERRFIPILFSGDWDTSMPIWAKGKRGVDFRFGFDGEFETLLDAFEEYETMRRVEILDIDREIKSEDKYDVPFKKRPMFSIMNEKGVDEIVEVIAYFTLNSTNEDYLIYTKNETDKNGNVLVMTSKVLHVNDETVELVEVSDAEWIEIKEVMRQMATEE